MEWVEIMLIFCVASEIARDMCEQLLSEPTLLPHDLEDIMIPSGTPLVKACQNETDAFFQLIEVHVDDLMSVVQAKSAKELQHATRALLHGIESIFLDGMLMPKLHKEGKWESKKEILGWIFDGVARTMQLPVLKY